MKITLRTTLRILLSVLLLFLLVFAILFSIRPSPAGISLYLFEPEKSTRQGDLTIRFLGNTNLLFSDGETSILTDGFFSRPSAFKVLFGKVTPKEDRITWCLEKAGIKGLNAVIPLHSHYDHAMDAPTVASMTGAKLIGSSSTLNIGRGYGLPDSVMMEPQADQSIEIGKFRLTFIPSRHWQYPSDKQREALLDQGIEEPLKTPASIYDYKEGVSYTLLIEYDTIRMAVQGSAGFREGSLGEYDANILFLAVAGLDVMDEAYNRGYQEHLIGALSPEILVPIHWDDFTVPLSRGLKPPNLLFNWKMGSDLDRAFEELASGNLGTGREIRVLPLWSPVSLGDLLQKKKTIP